MKIIWQIFGILICTGQFALSAPVPKMNIRDLVEQFYQLKESRAFPLDTKLSPHHPVCDEHDAPTYVDVACEKLGTWGCDSLDEIKAVGVACRGNYDGECLGAVCQKLGTWGCDNISEITEVARACVGNYETSCFDSVCQKLGTWGCDSISEVTEVLKTCAGN